MYTMRKQQQRDGGSNMTPTLEEMLSYYGCKTLEDFGRELGYYNTKDARMALERMYEEDMLWEDYREEITA